MWSNGKTFQYGDGGILATMPGEYKFLAEGAQGALLNASRAATPLYVRKGSAFQKLILFKGSCGYAAAAA